MSTTMHDIREGKNNPQPTPAEPPFWKVLNSPLLILLITLTAGGLGSLVTFIVTKQSENRKEEEDRKKEEAKQEAEFAAHRTELKERNGQSGAKLETTREQYLEHLKGENWVRKSFYYRNNEKLGGGELRALNTAFKGMSYNAVASGAVSILRSRKPDQRQKLAEILAQIEKAGELLRDQMEAQFHKNPRIAPNIDELADAMVFLATLPDTLQSLYDE